MGERLETEPTRPRAATALIGGAIAFYAVFDALTVGLPILVLSVRFNSLAVFTIAVLSVFVLNVACCTWIDDNWAAWIAGSGARVESKLQRLRTSKSLQKPVGWIQSGSAKSYALAAAVINAILVVAAARALTGRVVGAGRIRTAALSYALLFAGVFSACGYALGKVVDAVSG